jgi:peptidoglycan/xylan/chitin deacetylase (PgdA/CDA1 family)
LYIVGNSKSLKIKPKIDQKKLFNFSYLMILYFLHALIGLSFIFGSFTSLTPNVQYSIQHSHNIGKTINIQQFLKAQPKPSPKQVFLPILMYHHIDTLEHTSPTDKIGIDLRVSPNVFEDQLKYLRDHDFTSITSQEFGDYLDGNFKLPNKPILLTFDDGYKDNFTNALPLLKKYGFKGDFAIITSVVGTGEYMSWDDIQGIVDAKMGVSSHSVSHCYLSPSYPAYHSKKPVNNIDPENISDKSICPKFDFGGNLNTGQVFQELSQSKTTLESKLGIKITQMVYPYGHYNIQVETLAKEADYKFATTTEAQHNKEIDLNNLFATPRIRIHGQQAGKLDGFFGS